MCGMFYKNTDILYNVHGENHISAKYWLFIKYVQAEKMNVSLCCFDGSKEQVHSSVQQFMFKMLWPCCGNSLLVAWQKFCNYERVSATDTAQWLSVSVKGRMCPFQSLECMCEAIDPQKRNEESTNWTDVYGCAAWTPSAVRMVLNESCQSRVGRKWTKSALTADLRPVKIPTIKTTCGVRVSRKELRRSSQDSELVETYGLEAIRMSNDTNSRIVRVNIFSEKNS